MLVYWNAGQDGFWDPAYDGAGLDLASPLGFEPLIASDPYSLRTDVLNSLIPSEPALWLDPDPGVGPLTPAFASVCLLYTSPSPRDVEESRMPSSA